MHDGTQRLTTGSRALCVTAPDGEAVARALAAAPADAIGELRADLLDADALRSGAWRELPRRSGRAWVFTWRSPVEGGGGETRPPGLRRDALEAGYRWVDVEAAEGPGFDAETAAIPAERRWLSRHLAAGESEAALDDLWRPLATPPAALRKLVLTASRFADNDRALALVDRLGAEDSGRAFSVFAQGALGHPSRILGGLRGNAVTFVAAGAGTAAGQPSLERVLSIYRWREQPASPPLYGVIGRPALGSRSPELHNAAFAAADLEALYLPIEVDDPDAVLAWLRSGRLRGASVTSPWKDWAAEVCDVIDDAARGCGAVNTLARDGDRIRGTNTDRLAARELLAGLGVGRGDAVAVLGAGGAARAAACGAEDLGASVTMATRRGPDDPAARGERPFVRLTALEPRRFRAVVNATRLGTRAPIPPSLLEARWDGAALLDLSYGETESAWMALARRAGLDARDGHAFLARQGRHQFAFWTGREPAAGSFSEAPPR